MDNLKDLIWTEKYRPKTFDDLILKEDYKTLISQYLDNEKNVPSFIFYSPSPGTGKTSMAKVIVRKLGCDVKVINSSDERGIDTIREIVKMFAQACSTNGKQRCIILEEADGLTSIAQNCLRDIIETYSDNCFFIFTCNDFTKIIDPIRSRCIAINFSTPDRVQILEKLVKICETEKLLVARDTLKKLVDECYPDIREMVKRLQMLSTGGELLLGRTTDFENFLKAIKTKDFDYIKAKTYDGSFDVMEFVRWFFEYVFKNMKTLGLEKSSQIALLLADIEKSWDMGVAREIVFLANIIEISRIGI